MTWKEQLLSAAVVTEDKFDQLKNRLFSRLDAHKPYQIIYYRGFGSPTAVWIKGRILRQRDLPTPRPPLRRWGGCVQLPGP